MRNLTIYSSLIFAKDLSSQKKNTGYSLRNYELTLSKKEKYQTANVFWPSVQHLQLYPDELV